MLVAPQKTAPRLSQRFSSHISCFFAAIRVVAGGGQWYGGMDGREAALTRFDI